MRFIYILAAVLVIGGILWLTQENEQEEPVLDDAPAETETNELPETEEETTTETSTEESSAETQVGTDAGMEFPTIE